MVRAVADLVIDVKTLGSEKASKQVQSTAMATDKAAMATRRLNDANRASVGYFHQGANAARTSATAMGRNSRMAGQLGFQLNDIGVMMAAGAKPVHAHGAARHAGGAGLQPDDRFRRQDRPGYLRRF